MVFSVALLFIWAGFILSISFFESWMKFKANGVTLPVALSIGKLIFTVLNRIEWGFAILLLLTFYFSVGNASAGYIHLVSILISLLILQTFWLLPKLNTRATRRINGESLSASSLHLCFVIIEMIKLVLLVYIGVLFLYQIQNN